MTKGQAWLKALRLRTLPLSLSGIILGSFIAFKNEYWDSSIFILAMITTILFQIVSNLANDLGDSQKGADNENRVGPIRAVQSGLISQSEMKIAVILTSAISICTSLPLIYLGTKNMSSNILWFYLLLALLCILAAITYTVGKRAYGYSGFGDVFVFVFFGLVSVLGVYSLYAKSFDWLNVFPAIAIGLFSTAVLNLNNMRDRVNDEKVGKKTLVVQIGGYKAKFYHIFLILGGIISLFIFLFVKGSMLSFFGLLPCLFFIVHLNKIIKIQNPVDFDPELKKVALTTFLIALSISVFININ
jgi:1,4-dihydroxy-2-naphthoate octaprenyltransferase